MHGFQPVKRVARLGTILLLLLPACDGSMAADAGGPRSFADGSVPADGGIFADGGAVPAGDENPGRAGICYDGIDNDGDGPMDCDDSGCAGESVCCVGSVDCCANVSMVEFSVPVSCTDATFMECDLDASFVAFGAIEPDFERGELVPQGGTTYGGFTLGPAIDPRAANVTLEASITVPTSRCTDCIDAAGVAFFEEVPATGERGVVRLGVLVNGSREEVQVIVDDRLVAREPLRPGALDVSVVLRADGSASIGGLRAEGFELEAIDLPETLSPVVFGRTDNRATGVEAVGVVSARVNVDQCDMPSALVRRADPVLPSSSTAWVPTGLGRPTVIDVGETAPQLRVVFAHQGELLSGGINAMGELVGTSGPPDAAVTASDDGETVRDPWLVQEDSGRVLLYFVADNGMGNQEIRRANSGTDLVFGDSMRIGLPAEIAMADGPTVWLPTDEGDFWHMIVRFETPGGSSELIALISLDGIQFDWAHLTHEASVVHRASPDDAFAIDRDEVASPALVRVGNTWRLYYAARRGGRWSIGLLVSREGVAWRSLGRVLAGDAQGFDALGVLHPAPVVIGDAVRLYYVGTDGAENVIGLSGPAGTLGE